MIKCLSRLFANRSESHSIALSGEKLEAEHLRAVCRRVDHRGSAVERKAGSGRPKSARSDKNIAAVSELICSQEDQPGTSKSIRTIVAEIGVSVTSVKRIAKNDLKLSSFKRLPIQVISEDTR